MSLQQLTFNRYRPFSYEVVQFGYAAGGTRVSTITKSNSTAYGYEPIAYIGIATSISVNSEAYTNFTWNGAGSDFAVSRIDNSDDEHVGGYIGLKNINPGDGNLQKDMQVVTSTVVSLGFIHACLILLGGGGGVPGKTWVNVGSANRSSSGYPYTYTLTSLLPGDVVLCTMNYRQNVILLGNSSATNMTRIVTQSDSAYRNQDAYIAIVESAGSFSTTISAPNRAQQWVDMITAFRQQ